jgi:hypothetical protein
MKKSCMKESCMGKSCAVARSDIFPTAMGENPADVRKERARGRFNTARRPEAMLTLFKARISRFTLGVGIIAAAAAGTAVAIAQQADQIMPLPGEVRLTLGMGARTIAFPAKMAPIARESIPFEADGHAVTAEGREAMARLQEALFRQPGGSLVLVVYGEDETLAYRRAKAVRGELAERHSMDPARIIAAGRKAEGHQGDLAVVDVYGADATRCGGCAGATFRTVALDSATMGLVTMTPETLPQAATAPKPATPPVATRTAVGQPRIAAASPAAAAVPTPRAAPALTPPPGRVTAVQATVGCARPKVIIDDYYPGGPIVPCRPAR